MNFRYILFEIRYDRKLNKKNEFLYYFEELFEKSD